MNLADALGYQVAEYTPAEVAGGNDFVDGPVAVLGHVEEMVLAVAVPSSYSAML